MRLVQGPLGEARTKLMIQDTLAQQGLRVSGEAGAREFAGTMTRSPVPAESFLEQMTTARTPERVGEIAQSAKQAVKSAPIRGGVKAAGGIGAALLLLPLLSRIMGGGGGGARQLPPMMQLQMMNQMQEMQNQNALTQSLVGSRGAQADRDAARAALLRLQALQLAGGTGQPFT